MAKDLRDQNTGVERGESSGDPSVAAAYRLQLAITRVARLLRQEVHAELTPSQISALSAIRRYGPMTLGDLADRERVAPPSVTRMVDRLEQEGYVERLADPQDRRVCRVVITERAEQMVAAARARKAAWLAARMSELPAADRRRLVAAADSIERLADLS